MHESILRLADIYRTCNKIRAAIFRTGLNLWDWYLPLDPDRNHLISESKFASILAGPLRQILRLSEQEICQLADYFKTSDGRILYFQMCEVIHGDVCVMSLPGEFPSRLNNPPHRQKETRLHELIQIYPNGQTISDGVKSPDRTESECQLLDSCPPPLPPPCRTLNPWQRHRLCLLLATIASRQLILRPYFQDYELVAKGNGRITFAHFARILNFLSVHISAEDFNLLVRRFIKDSYTIDYIDFLRLVDEVHKYGVKGLGPEGDNPRTILNTKKVNIDQERFPMRPSDIFGENDIFHPTNKKIPKRMKLVETMLRIQKFIKCHRIRVSEFLRDFDPLNSGRILAIDFRRGDDLMGLSGFGHDMYLDEGEIECIIRHYTDPNDNQKVCWRTFDDDIDQVFTVKELEKYPELKVVSPPDAVTNLPPAGAMSWETISVPQLNSYDTAILRIKEKLVQRPLDLKTFFQDHDKPNNGHVTIADARRALARAGISMSQQQILALENHFCDDIGFYYIGLLKVLDLLEPPEREKTETLKEQMQRLNTRPKDPSAHETNIVEILAKIKGKVVRERINILSFLQPHDYNNEFVISRENFYRGLIQASLELTPFEMDTLMEVYASPLRRRYVDYRRFCDTIEEVFCQSDLERAPLLVPVQHLPSRTGRRNFLNFEERHVVSVALQKMAKRPNLCTNVMEVFRDFDKQNCGTVAKSQFERALTLRRLSDTLSSREMDVVCKCFGFERGCGDEVDYRAFDKTLNVLHESGKHQLPC